MLPGQLVEPARPESSATVAARVRTAWDRALKRNGGRPNAALTGQRLIRACGLDQRARDTLKEVATGMELTARSVHRMMRVARTVADLRGEDVVRSDEILAATSMRDRSMEADLAA